MDRMVPGIDYTGITTVFFCHDGRGNFLLGKRSQKCRDEQGSWEAGAGQLEFGESPEEGVLRELSEEYCCQGVIEAELPPVSLVREHEGKKTHWIAHPFFIRIDPAEVRIGDPDSIDECSWFRLDSLPTPLHTGFQTLLSLYQEHFRKYSV